MLPKVDKYILSEFWLPLTSSAGIITGVWLGIDKFREVFRLLARSGASIDKGIAILGLEIPEILSMTIPIGILMAAFMTFQKLSSQSEIIAMRAAGISFLRVLRAAVILGLLAATTNFILSEVVVPITSPLARKMYAYTLYKDPITKKKKLYGFSYFEKTPKSGDLRRIFYVGKAVDGNLENVVILDFTKRNISQIYTAAEGRWSPERGGWILKNGTSRHIKMKSAMDQYRSMKKILQEKLTRKQLEAENSKKLGKKQEEVEELQKQLDLLEQKKEEIQKNKGSGDKNPADLVSTFKSTFIPSGVDPNKLLKKTTSIPFMNITELKEYIDLHTSQNLKTSKLDKAKTYFHNKIAYPLASVILALIGACLGVVGRRKHVNLGYIVLGLVVFIFYMSQTIFLSFGESGKLAPMLAAWIPNIILGTLALGLVWYRTETN